MNLSTGDILTGDILYYFEPGSESNRKLCTGIHTRRWQQRIWKLPKSSWRLEIETTLRNEKQTILKCFFFTKPCVYQAEMEVVKTGMQHGDLSLDAYTQVTTIFHLCHSVTSINDRCRMILAREFKLCRSGRNVQHKCFFSLDSNDTQGDVTRLSPSPQIWF